MGLRILGRVTSINVRKVLWAAEELGLAYTREDWGKPLRDPHVPEFLALNPNAQVPVIVDDGFVLWESNAILRYLGEKHRALLPPDPRGRAIVDQWLYWQIGELNPAWVYAVNALMRRNPAYGDLVRTSESVARWAAKMAILEGPAGALQLRCRRGLHDRRHRHRAVVAPLVLDAHGAPALSRKRGALPAPAGAPCGSAVAHQRDAVASAATVRSRGSAGSRSSAIRQGRACRWRPAS